MTQRNKFKNAIILGGPAYTLLAISMSLSFAQANTISYTLDNVFFDATNQMTGTFEWAYSEGDFDNGTGLFSELFIPLTSRTLADLDVTFDVKKSIEFTLIQNLDGDGVDITLVFATPLSPTQSTLLDLTAPDGSKYSIGGAGTTKLFVSGSISSVPVPSRPGDFDFDNDVDGFDFLEWQRGESPNPFSPSDLTAWEENYGTVAPLSGIAAAVPEPASMALLALGGLTLLRLRRRTAGGPGWR